MNFFSIPFCPVALPTIFEDVFKQPGFDFMKRIFQLLCNSIKSSKASDICIQTIHSIDLRKRGLRAF